MLSTNDNWPKSILHSAGKYYFYSSEFNCHALVANPDYE